MAEEGSFSDFDIEMALNHDSHPHPQRNGSVIEEMTREVDDNTNIYFNLMKLKSPRPDLTIDDYLLEIIRPSNSKREEEIRGESAKRAKIEPDHYLESEKELIINWKKVFFKKYIITKKSHFRDGILDSNHAVVTFIYWKEVEEDVMIYCSVQSGRTSLWQNFLKYRDHDFVRRIPKNLLDPGEVLYMKARCILGFNQNSIFEYKPGKGKSFKDMRYMVEKCAIIKEMKVQLLKPIPEVLMEFVASSIPWHIQVGQIKIPVKSEKMPVNNNHFPMSTLALELHNSTYNVPATYENVRKWDELYFLEQIEVSSKYVPILMKRVKEDFLKCLKSSSYNPKYFKRKQPLKLDPEGAFSGCNNVKLVKKLSPNNFQEMPWVRGKNDLTIVRSGNDLLVSDLLKSIPVQNAEEFRLDSYFLEWRDGISSETKRNFVIDSVDATMIPVDDDDYVKAGKSFFRVHPDMINDIHQRFQETLKECYFREDKTMPFPIAWNNSEKKKSFTLDEFVQSCTKNGKSDFSDQAIMDILLQDFQILEQNGTILLDKKHKLNCCIVPACKCKDRKPCKCQCDFLQIKLKKKKSSLNKMLLLNEKLLDDDFQANYDILKESRKICQFNPHDQTYLVNNPILTKEIASSLRRANFCIPKTLQFLKSRLPNIHEGDYNELYHLSNCACHSKEWHFIVGDRILSSISPSNMELFDVMMYHKKKGIYLLHVKLGAGTTSVRECSSQVRTCEKTLKEWYNKKGSILDNIYEQICKVDDSSNDGQFVHRTLTKHFLTKAFGSKEKFSEQFRKNKVYICLALANDVAMDWKYFQHIDFKVDLSQVIQDHDLKKLKKLNWVKSNNSVDMQLMKVPKKTITDEFGSMDIYNKILKAIGPNLDHEIVKKVCSTPDIPKLEIIILQDNFHKHPCGEIYFCILPIPIN